MNRNLFGKGWTRHSRRRDWSDLRQWCGCTCIREWKNAATYFATTYKLVDKSLGKKYTESHMIWETKQIWRFAGQNEFLWITVAEHGNITTHTEQVNINMFLFQLTKWSTMPTWSLIGITILKEDTAGCDPSLMADSGGETERGDDNRQLPN